MGNMFYFTCNNEFNSSNFSEFYREQTTCGVCADHILIPKGPTGSGLFLGVLWKPKLFLIIILKVDLQIVGSLVLILQKMLSVLTYQIPIISFEVSY